MQLLGFDYEYLPAAPGSSGATLLLLHGTGGDEHDLIPLGRAISSTDALLSPRGKVLERGMPRFFRRLAEGVFDIEDLHRRTAELGEFVRAAAKEHGLDADRVIAVGLSNGANIAASMLLSDASVLRGAVLFRAMVPFEPTERTDLTGRGVLVAAGTADPLIGRAGTERLIDLLEERGAAVEVVWQRAGHGLVQEDLAAAQRWLLAFEAGLRGGAGR